MKNIVKNIIPDKQRGAAHLLLLFAVISLIGFIVISQSSEFKNKLFATLFPKKPSFAVESIRGLRTPIPITPTGLTNCENGYYTYQQPLNSEVPTLDDLFNGRAKFQDVSESEQVRLRFNPSDVTHVWDQKLSIIHNKNASPNQRSYKYYAFTRGYNENTTRDRGSPNWSYNMYILGSNDGINFEQVGKIFDQTIIDSLGSMYDGQVSIDYSVCPNRYVMALEGSGRMYVSFSTTPFVPLSWSRPVKIVDDFNHKSASTGVFLIDGINKYASWTVVDDNPAGNQSTYSKGVSTSDFSNHLGNSSIGNTLLPAEINTHCTSSWDCNNRDKEDWIKEGDWYYLLYAGANYYRCERPRGDTGTNIWGLGLARSREALGGYESGFYQQPGKGPGEIFRSAINNACAMSYPVISNINGELYMYYSAHSTPQDRTPTNNNDVHRSKIVWVPSPSPIPSPSEFPSPSISPSPSPSPSSGFSLTGTIFIDSNDNNVFDQGEQLYTSGTQVMLRMFKNPPSPNADVSGINNPVTSDKGGKYTFTNVPEGQYWLDIAIPSGFKITRNNSRIVSAPSQGGNAFNFAIVPN